MQVHIDYTRVYEASCTKDIDVQKMFIRVTVSQSTV